jgi:YD repeat-containing protein
MASIQRWWWKVCRTRRAEGGQSLHAQMGRAWKVESNRTTYTATITQTAVTTYTHDAANRLTKRVVDGDDVYLYTWSDAGQLTREEWNGFTLHTFEYDGAGWLVKATLPGFTMTFRCDGDGQRLVKAVRWLFRTRLVRAVRTTPATPRAPPDRRETSRGRKRRRRR